MNISARSVRVLSDRRATRQLRNSRRIRVFASLDTAGEKFTKCFPNLAARSRSGPAVLEGGAVGLSHRRTIPKTSDGIRGETLILRRVS